MKTLYSIAIILLLAAAGVVGYLWVTSPDASRVTIEKGKISDLRPMMQLCSVELFEEFPIKAHIGSRHFVAKARLNGSIAFDLDNIDMTESGDTLSVTLPREIVEVFESTEPGAYKVIDTWNDKLLGSANFTTAEENDIKSKFIASYRNSIYRRGLVRKARAEAAANLKQMLASLTGKTVIVSDPTPDGQP